MARQQAQAIHAGKLHIRYDDLIGFRLQFAIGREAIVNDVGLVALPVKTFSDEVADQGVVIDNQDSLARCHYTLLL